MEQLQNFILLQDPAAEICVITRIYKEKRNWIEKNIEGKSNFLKLATRWQISVSATYIKVKEASMLV